MARWTDVATWVGPTTNSGDGDSAHLETADLMSQHRGLVIHIAEGSYAGTIAWQKNPSADVSSHFIVAKDGRVAQMVDTAEDSWCQIEGNDTWLSVENEGFTPHPLTDAQLNAIARLLAKAHKEYGVPLQVATSPSGRGLGHHSMGAEHGVNWGHPDCPGPAIVKQKPEIVARAQAIVNGDDMALTDPDINKIADAVWAKMLGSSTLGEHSAADWLKQGLDIKTNQLPPMDAKLDQILTGIASGVTVPAQVSLTPESVAAVADATADELHADPERDGKDS